MPDNDQNGNEDHEQGDGGTPVSFEAWLAEQTDDVKAAYETHTAGLKKALGSEREMRKRLEKYEAAERQRQEAEMTELQKAQAKLAEMEQAIQETTQRAQRTALSAEFKTQAALAGAAHPEDALALAGDAARYFAEDGNVQGVAEAVKALIEAGRLPTRGKPQPPSLDAGAGSGQRTGERKAETATDAEVAIARKMGLTVEQYLAAKQATR